MFNEKTIRIIKIATVSAIVFLILMITALILNLVKLGSLSSRKDALEEQLNKLESTIDSNTSEIDYRKTDEYIDQFVREWLNMQGKDDEAFFGKN